MNNRFEENRIQDEIKRRNAKDNLKAGGILVGVAGGITTDIIVGGTVYVTTGFTGWHIAATLSLLIGIPAVCVITGLGVGAVVGELLFSKKPDVPEINLDEPPTLSSTKRLAKFLGCCLGNQVNEEIVPVVTVRTDLVTDHDLSSENQFENVHENVLRMG